MNQMEMHALNVYFESKPSKIKIKVKTKIVDPKMFLMFCDHIG